MKDEKTSVNTFFSVLCSSVGDRGVMIFPTSKSPRDVCGRLTCFVSGDILDVT